MNASQSRRRHPGPRPSPISHADVAEEIWQVLRRKAAGERDVPPLGLVVQGGGMRGVYSMAVLAAFEEMGWTRCFDHVAGASEP